MARHEGWYIVWRYLVDRTMQIEAARAVVIWRVDLIYLRKSDSVLPRVDGSGRLPPIVEVAVETL